ncbi:hypothetical protein TWF481_008035 [Arthrobotrys musiformis]|uniref:Altered inheritance of mitochondria protein 41 n=1 Tax=Arthrobotrys musiformis TaxID=47236 RepID=A0AAV9W5Y9_9PEZI
MKFPRTTPILRLIKAANLKPPKSTPQHKPTSRGIISPISRIPVLSRGPCPHSTGLQPSLYSPSCDPSLLQLKERVIKAATAAPPAIVFRELNGLVFRLNKLAEAGESKTITVTKAEIDELAESSLAMQKFMETRQAAMAIVRNQWKDKGLEEERADPSTVRAPDE